MILLKWYTTKLDRQSHLPFPQWQRFTFSIRSTSRPLVLERDFEKRCQFQKMSVSAPPYMACLTYPNYYFFLGVHYRFVFTPSYPQSQWLFASLFFPLFCLCLTLSSFFSTLSLPPLFSSYSNFLPLPSVFLLSSFSYFPFSSYLLPLSFLPVPA